MRVLVVDVTTRTTKDIDVIITDLEGQGEASLVYQRQHQSLTNQLSPLQGILA